MCANVYGQCASLYKALNTTQMNAAVWSFIRMYPVMSLEVRFTVETLLSVQSAFYQLDFWRGGERKKHMPEFRLTFGQPFGQEHVNGRVAGRPAEGSRSEMVAMTIQKNFQAIEEINQPGWQWQKLGQVRMFWRAKRLGGEGGGQYGVFLFFIFVF